MDGKTWSGVWHDGNPVKRVRLGAHSSTSARRRNMYFDKSDSTERARGVQPPVLLCCLSGPWQPCLHRLRLEPLATLMFLCLPDKRASGLAYRATVGRSFRESWR